MSVELETQVAQHEVKIKQLEKRVLKCESKDEILNKLVVSVETMAVVQKEMLDDMKADRERRDKNEERIHNLEVQPAKDAHEIKQKVLVGIITGVISIILGAVLGLVIKG